MNKCLTLCIFGAIQLMSNVYAADQRPLTEEEERIARQMIYQQEQQRQQAEQQRRQADADASVNWALSHGNKPNYFDLQNASYQTQWYANSQMNWPKR